MNSWIRKYEDFEINIIPAFSDNYIYLLRCFKSNKTICVDPGDFNAVDNFLKENHLNLDFIIITHKHFDHTGGVESLKKKYKCKTLVSKDDEVVRAGGDIFIDLDEKRVQKGDAENDANLEVINDVSRETFRSKNAVIGDSFQIGEIVFNVFPTFGHCTNHVSYFIKSENILFCGDTLFSSGCGRIHPDGSVEELFKSLNRIRKLPIETQIYVAHEYTLKNIEFALTLEPNNKDLFIKKRICKELRNNNQPTVPTNLESEIKTNPFLRFNSEELRSNLGIKNDECDLEVFRKTRHLKDNF